MMTPAVDPAPRVARPRLVAGRWTVAAWLVLGIGLLAALGAGTAALTVRRYPDATTVVGEIGAGRRIGQTITARYTGLAGIDLLTATYDRRLGGEVVLQVRPSPHVTTTLANVRLPVADLPNNAWYHFAFPPLAVGPGTPLYFELTAPDGAPGNAPTLYWYTGPGDPYGEGQAVFDGAAQPGDLAFALHYASPPGEPWLVALRTLAAQLPTRPAATLPLAALLLLAPLAWGLAARRQGAGGRGQGAGTNETQHATRNTQHTAPLTHYALRITHYASRLTLPYVLAVALLHGWLWLWLVPPWQGPDEPQHYAAAALGARQPVGAILAGGTPDPAQAPDLEPVILAAMDRHGFTRTVTWYGAKGGPAADFIGRPAFGGSSMYVQLRQPSLYYQWGALALRAAGGGTPGRLDPDIGLYLLRMIGLALQMGIVALGWGAAALLTPGQPGAGVRLTLPLALALLPMPAFIHTTANNDVPAAVFVSASGVAALAWLREPKPLGRRGLAWGAVSLGAGLLGLLTKSTAVPALVFCLGAALFIAGRQARAGLTRSRPRARRVAAGAGLLLLVGVGIAIIAGVDTRPTAWGWSYEVAMYADRRAVGDAHEGAWVLAPAAGRAAAARADLPPGHGALRLDAGGWVRALAPAPARLALEVDGRIVSSATLALPGGPAWTPITATTTAPAGSVYARVLVFSPQTIEGDDLRLAATGLAPSAVPVPAGNLLGNPSAEGGAVALAPWLRGGLAAIPGANADELAAALLNPLPFDLGAALREYADLQGRSFWGLFGWLALPLPDGWYALWWVLAALAVPGLLLAWSRLSGPARAWLVLSVAALLTAEGLAVGKALAQRALFGLRDPPQGRYLFVLLIPLTWLLLTGLWGIADCGLRIADWRRRVGAVLPRVALVGWILLLTLFTAWALLAGVIPYYYGG